MTRQVPGQASVSARSAGGRAQAVGVAGADEQCRAEQHVAGHVPGEVDAEERELGVRHGVDERAHEPPGMRRQPQVLAAEGHDPRVRRGARGPARRSAPGAGAEDGVAALTLPRAARITWRPAGARRDLVPSRSSPPSSRSSPRRAGDAGSRRCQYPASAARRSGRVQLDLLRSPGPAGAQAGPPLARAAPRGVEAGPSSEGSRATISLPQLYAGRRGARVVGRAAPPDAQPRLERARLVVDPGVHDAAVVAGLVGPTSGSLSTTTRPGAAASAARRRRRADDPSADDGDVGGAQRVAPDGRRQASRHPSLAPLRMLVTGAGGALGPTCRPIAAEGSSSRAFAHARARPGERVSPLAEVVAGRRADGRRAWTRRSRASTWPSSSSTPWRRWPPRAGDAASRGATGWPPPTFAEAAARGRAPHRLPRRPRPRRGPASTHLASRLEVEEILLAARPSAVGAAGVDRHRRAVALVPFLVRLVERVPAAAARLARQPHAADRRPRRAGLPRRGGDRRRRSTGRSRWTSPGPTSSPTASWSTASRRPARRRGQRCASLRTMTPVGQPRGRRHRRRGPRADRPSWAGLEGDLPAARRPATGLFACACTASAPRSSARCASGRPREAR